MSEPDWGIRFRALDEAGANEVVAYAESLGFDGFASDPYVSYEELFDRDGVLVSMKLFEAALETGRGLLPREEMGAESIVSELREWMAFADGSLLPVPDMIRRIEPERRGWGVKLMGLDREGASHISAHAIGRRWEHVVVDPAKWCEFSVDSASVAIDIPVIRAGLASARLSESERAWAHERLEDEERWLAVSFPPQWD